MMLHVTGRTTKRQKVWFMLILALVGSVLVNWAIIGITKSRYNYFYSQDKQVANISAPSFTENNKTTASTIMKDSQRLLHTKTQIKLQQPKLKLQTRKPDPKRPCYVAITNRLPFHYETLESVAALFPVQWLGNLGNQNTTTNCNPQNLVFDYFLVTGKTKNQQGFRYFSFQKYFDSHLKNTQVDVNDNLTRWAYTYAHAMGNTNTTSTKFKEARHIRHLFPIDDESMESSSIMDFVPYYNITKSNSNSNNNNGSHRKSNNNQVVSFFRYDATVEASCFCLNQDQDLYVNWLDASSAHSCVFHDSCDHYGPRILENTRAVWLSPHHERYYIPTLLPRVVPTVSSSSSSSLHPESVHINSNASANNTSNYYYFATTNSISNKDGNMKSAASKDAATSNVKKGHQFCVIGQIKRRAINLFLAFNKSPNGKKALQEGHFHWKIIGGEKPPQYKTSREELEFANRYNNRRKKDHNRGKKNRNRGKKKAPAWFAKAGEYLMLYLKTFCSKARELSPAWFAKVGEYLMLYLKTFCSKARELFFLYCKTVGSFLGINNNSEFILDEYILDLQENHAYWVGPMDIVDFQKEVMECDAIVGLTTTRMNGLLYFNQEGSLKMLSGAITNILAYQKPYVLHRELQDLYQHYLPKEGVVPSGSHGDDAHGFINTMTQFVKDMDNFKWKPTISRYPFHPFPSRSATATIWLTSCETREGHLPWFHMIPYWKTPDGMDSDGNLGVGAASNLMNVEVKAVNVCAGITWDGLPMKLKYLQRLLAEIIVPEMQQKNENANHQTLMLFSDSDATLNTPAWTPSELVARFNDMVAQGNHSMVVNGEPNCYIGRSCVDSDFEVLYPGENDLTSCPMYLNSGVYMGDPVTILRMMDVILGIRNDDAAFLDLKEQLRSKETVGHDQFDITVWYAVHRDIVMIDRSASLFRNLVFGTVDHTNTTDKEDGRLVQEKWICGRGTQQCEYRYPGPIFGNFVGGENTSATNPEQNSVLIMDPVPNCPTGAEPFVFHGPGKTKPLLERTMKRQFQDVGLNVEDARFRTVKMPKPRKLLIW